MDEEQKDVEVVDSSATEVSQEGVQEAEEPQQPQQEVETSIETAPPVGQPQAVEELDERGVPWKNVAMESQRKLEKVTKQQEEILEKVSSLSQGQQEPQYTVEELELFASHEDTAPAHRAWAMSEIRKREELKMSEVVKSEFEKREQVGKTEQMKKDALSQVMARHPEAFVKDNAGQIVSWNLNSPLSKRIGEYMNDPEIANNPRGLIVASALAYQDIATAKQIDASHKISTLKNEAGSLKKKTLVEAGTNAGVAKTTPRQEAINKSRSGNPKDAVDAMKELWKATGRL